MKGGKSNEKVFEKNVLRTIAKTVLKTAKKSCGAASTWDMYQPKEPEALKKLRK